MEDSTTNQALLLLQSLTGNPRGFTQSPSPFAHWLQGHLKKAERGALEWEFVVRKDMTNPTGVLHGGVISGMIDDVIGATSFSLGKPNFYTSINLVVDFIASAHEGEKVIAKSQLLKEGKNVIIVECHLYNEQGKLLARATSNLIKTKVPMAYQ